MVLGPFLRILYKGTKFVDPIDGSSYRSFLPLYKNLKNGLKIRLTLIKNCLEKNLRINFMILSKGFFFIA